MQIAKVVPKIKTSSEGIFDYSIPPQILPDIKIGLLVLVPFHGRKIQGIIIDIKKSSQISNLKPIIAVIDKSPVVDNHHIQLAKWMADYYLTDLSKCLFENIVPPAKRILKKQENQIIITKISPINNPKKYLIRADFKERLKFYLRAIKKTIGQKRTVILLLPDLSLVQFFKPFLPYKIAFLHAGLSLSQRWIMWNDIRSGLFDIVIGSTSALFAPINNLGLIIIDQEENETYKSDQAPRFNTYTVSKKLAEITRANLIVGSLTPSFSTYGEALNQKFLYEQKLNEKNITLVDMNFERSIVSGPLSQAIGYNFEQRKKTVLVINRKGEGRLTVCQDCGWKAICPNCSANLIKRSDKNECIKCNKRFPIQAVCPNCQSANLVNKGMTTGRLKKILAEKWPALKIIQIEKDRNLPSEDWDLAVVTSFALKINLGKIGLVGLIDADQDINSSYRSEELNFFNQYKFINLAERAIIQTHLSQKSYFKYLAKFDYRGFYEDQLKLREQYHFPPFYQLTELLYKNKNQTEAKNEAAYVAKNLKSLIKDLELETELIGPMTVKLGQQNFFSQQLVLKAKKPNQKLNQTLKNLKNNWTINVDPFNLG